VKRSAVLVALLLFINFSRFFWASLKGALDMSELWQGTFALYIIKFGILNYLVKIPFLVGPHHGPLMGYFLIPSIHFLGQTAVALRLPRLIIGIFTIVLTYMFAKEFYDKKTALLTLFALIILPVHFPNSQELILPAFFVVLSLYLFNRHCKYGSTSYLYLFSFVCGLGMIARLSFTFFLISLIASFRVVYKNIEFNYTRLIVGTFVFLLGFYPFIVFNQNMDAARHEFVLDNFPGTATRGNLQTFNFFTKNFPQTEWEVDILDMGKNLKRGLLERFPEIFKSQFSFFPHSVVLSLFLISLFGLLTLNLSEWVKCGYNSVRKKDLFLIVNFFVIVILISSVTPTTFRTQEFWILIPICAIIIGITLSEILISIKDLSQKLYYSLVPAVLFLILIHITYSFICSIYTNNVAIKKESLHECVFHPEKVVDAICNIEHSCIVVNRVNFIFQLNWYLYKRMEYKEKFYNFFCNSTDREKLLNDNKALYVFGGTNCLSREAVKRGNTIENFLDYVDKYRKKAVMEELFLSETGDVAYAIYRIP